VRADQTVETPARLSIAAAVEPASPPPITAMSGNAIENLGFPAAFLLMRDSGFRPEANPRYSVRVKLTNLAPHPAFRDTI